MRRRCIIVGLRGGLGNQLFQYAAARAVAARSGLPVVLDNQTGFRNDLFHRRYELGAFKIEARLAVTAELPWVMRLPVPVRGVVTRLRVVPGYLRERHPFQYEPELQGPGYMWGYFQSWRYAAECGEALRRELVLARPMGAEGRRLLEQVLSCESIALHMRSYAETRAMRSPSHHPMGEGYFQQALRRALKHATNGKIFLFSDDLDWATAQPFLKGRNFVVCRLKSAVEELHVMAACRHRIVSNSTFGWWGAWLGGNSEGIVVCPAAWENLPADKTRDLIPEGWQTV